MNSMHNIRNFSIIAHIDHGKFTLADRLIQASMGALPEDGCATRLLDSDGHRGESGTSPSRATPSPSRTAPRRPGLSPQPDRHPGARGFFARGARALAPATGCMILVDASQGVEAETVANLYLALDHELAHHPGDQQDRPPPADVAAVEERSSRSWSWTIDTAILCSAKERPPAWTTCWRQSWRRSRRPRASPRGR